MMTVTLMSEENTIDTDIHDNKIYIEYARVDNQSNIDNDVDHYYDIRMINVNKNGNYSASLLIGIMITV